MSHRPLTRSAVTLFAALLVGAAVASSQTTTTPTDRVKLKGGPCIISAGSASPSGGTNCDVYVKSDGTAWIRNGGMWLPLLQWTRSGTTLSPATSGDDVSTTGGVYASGFQVGGPKATLSLDSEWLQVNRTQATPDTAVGLSWEANGAPQFSLGFDYQMNELALYSYLLPGDVMRMDPITGKVTLGAVVGTPSVENAELLVKAAESMGYIIAFRHGLHDVSWMDSNGVLTLGGVLATNGPGGETDLTVNGTAAGTAQVRWTKDGGGKWSAYVPANSNDLRWWDNDADRLTFWKGGAIGASNYAAQTTGWQIGWGGSADLRAVYTDELHAKSFVADLEQALAGSQIITKSVSLLSAAFTCPSAGAAATLSVEDLPGAADMQVFQAADYVVLRSFSRSGGALTIGDCVGTVSSPSTAPSGYQTWTFTRASGGSAGTMSGGTVIPAKSLALDYGVSGAGYWETTAVDGTYGASSPYAQVVTWATAPVTANKTVRARMGQLTGLTGTSEYGLLAGSYAATNGAFLRASNQHFDLQGITAKWWDSTSNVITIAPNSGSPYFGLGNPAPSSCCSSAGIFLGWDHTATKAKASFYSDANNFLTWDGSKLTWKGANSSLDSSGNLTATGGTIGGWTLGSTTLSASSGSNSVVMDAGNGRVVWDNGAYMKVTGTGFGSSSQFIEWYGPHQSDLATCTEANATYYLKTDGTAYFGGALLAGVLKNSVQGTVLDATNTAAIGPFSSNGGTITVTWSWSFSSYKTYLPSDYAGWAAADQTAPSGTIALARNGSGVASLGCTGTVVAEAPNGVDSGYIRKTMNCSSTYTDPDHNTTPRSYGLSISANSHVYVPGGVLQNTLALQSIEQ